MASSQRKTWRKYHRRSLYLWRLLTTQINTRSVVRYPIESSFSPVTRWGHADVTQSIKNLWFGFYSFSLSSKAHSNKSENSKMNLSQQTISAYPAVYHWVKFITLHASFTVPFLISVSTSRVRLWHESSLAFGTYSSMIFGGQNWSQRTEYTFLPVYISVASLPLISRVRPFLRSHLIRSLSLFTGHYSSGINKELTKAKLWHCDCEIAYIFSLTRLRWYTVGPLFKARRSVSWGGFHW